MTLLTEPRDPYLLAAATPCVPPAGVPDAADRLEASAGRLRALAVKVRRGAGRWNIESHPHVLDVPNYTVGLEHYPGGCCEARWTVPTRARSTWGPTRTFACTRIGEHTGRHAAAWNGRITAVWGDDR